MGFMRDFFGGFIEGIVGAPAARAGSGNGSQRGRIERLCHELGWSVDEREGNSIGLYFNSSDGEMRKVRISNGGKSIVGFYAHSDVILPAHRVPPNLPGYLLRRNLEDSGIGMWGISVDDDDEVTFHLCYMALGEGLNAETLKYICESLANEAADFDGKLRDAGLID